MFISELFEANEKKIVVILPGRFQPFHRGHAAVYQHLCNEYGTDNVYVVTSNKVDPPRSPFNFEEKQAMIALTGVDPAHIIQDAQPYQAKAFVARFDPKNTVLIFAVSEKDMAEDPRFQFEPGLISTTKDGRPKYFQQFTSINQCEPLDKHGYITTVPTFNFKVLGKPANSATQIRAQFADADEATQKKIVTDLFGKFDSTVLKIMQEKLSVHVVEESTEDSNITVNLDGVDVPGPYTDLDHAKNKAGKLINYQKGKVAEVCVNGKCIKKYELSIPPNFKQPTKTVREPVSQKQFGDLPKELQDTMRTVPKLNLTKIEEEFGTLYPMGRTVNGKRLNMESANFKLFSHLCETGGEVGLHTFYNIMSQKAGKTAGKQLTESVTIDESLNNVLSLFASFDTGNNVNEGDMISVIELSAWQTGNSSKNIFLEGIVQPSQVIHIDNNVIILENDTTWPNTSNLIDQIVFLKRDIFFHNQQDAEKCLTALSLYGSKHGDWKIDNGVDQGSIEEGWKGAVAGAALLGAVGAGTVAADRADKERHSHDIKLNGVTYVQNQQAGPLSRNHDVKDTVINGRPARVWTDWHKQTGTTHFYQYKDANNEKTFNFGESVNKFTTKNITEVNELYDYTKTKAKMLFIESAEDDKQILKIQSQHNVSRHQAAEMYYGGVRVPDDEPTSTPKDTDHKINEDATTFQNKKTFRPININASPKGEDWPISEKLINGINVTIMNHFMVRAHTKDQGRSDEEHAVDINKGLEVLKELCRKKKLFRNIQPGKFWVWSDTLHHSIGGVKQMDKNGVMQFMLKTILAKELWGSGIPVYTV